MSTKEVLILMGSDSDWPVMEAACDVLDDFGVGYEVAVSSAHRTPELTLERAKTAREKGFKVIIVGAGAAAHLAGVVASKSILPVIGVPLNATPLAGQDALYSTVMMPGGIPVATMSIGKAGSQNAALFALKLLAVTNEVVADQLIAYRKEMVAKVIAKNDALQRILEERQEKKKRHS
jgi:phosphoribosylaminoimidazole carboxylase PurE protein